MLEKRNKVLLLLKKEEEYKGNMYAYFNIRSFLRE